MANDIIDITHNLTFNVDNTGLKNTLNIFENQLTLLKRESDAYNSLTATKKKGSKDVADEEVKQQQRVQQEMLKTQRIIDDMNKRFGQQNLTRPGTAPNSTIGTVPSLFQRGPGSIADPSTARTIAATTQAIKTNAQVIQQAKPAYNGLAQAGSQIVRELPAAALGFQVFTLAISNNIPILLDQISIAKQAGQTNVQVFKNIASSVFSLNGIITLAVAAFTILSYAMSGSEDSAKQLEYSFEGLDNKILSAIETLKEYNRILGITQGLNEQEAKRQLELTKANGVVNGNIAAKEKQDFEAEQNFTGARIKDLQAEAAEVEKYKTRVLEALNTVEERRKNGSSDRLDIRNPSGIKEFLRQTNEQLGIYEIKVPESIKKTFDLEKSISAFADKITDGNYDLNKFTNDISDQFTISANTVSEKTKDLQNELTVNQKRFQDIYIQRQRELNIDLNNLLYDLQKEVAENNVDIQQEISYDDEEFINARLEIERAAALRSIDIAEQKAAKELTFSSNVADLTLETQRKFNQQRELLNKTINQKEFEITTDFYQKRSEAQRKFQIDQAQLELDTVKKELGLSIDLEEDTLGIRNEIAQKESQQAINAVYAKYDALFLAAKINVIETIQLEKDLQRDLENERVAGQRREIKSLEDSFEEKRKVLKAQGDRAVNDLLANNRGRGVAGQRIDTAEQTLAAANQNLSSAVLNPNATDASIAKAKDEVNKARIELNKLRREQTKSILNDVSRVENAVQNMITSIASAIQEVYRQQEKLLESQARAQEGRVDFLIKTSDRGNAELLRQEQERLNAINEERTKLARKEVELNKIVTASAAAKALAEAVSGVLVAATTTAEEGGGIIGFIAALAAGAAAVVGLVASLRSFSSSEEAFADGVVDYAGKGTGKSDSNVVRISRGESVITAEATQRYAPMLRAMNSGMPITRYMTGGEGFATKGELRSIIGRLDTLNETMSVNSTKVYSNITEDGIRVATEKSQRAETNKWKP